MICISTKNNLSKLSRDILNNSNKNRPGAPTPGRDSTSEDVHVWNKNIVSSSEQLRKRNTRSSLAVIFVPFFIYITKEMRQWQHTKS